MAHKPAVIKGNTPPPNGGAQPAPDTQELRRLFWALMALLSKFLMYQTNKTIQFRIWHVPVGILIFFAVFQLRQPASPSVVQYIVPEVPVKTTEEVPVVEAPVEKTAMKVEKPKSDYAPMAVSAENPEVQAYIDRFSKIAIAEMKKYGIPASISLAQGLVESRYGTSKLAKNNNNHFGIKCFGKKCRKGHCSNYEDDHHKDFFRKFSNPWESWRAHSQLLNNSNYGRLKKHGKDYRKWALGLKQLGYATDKKYPEKIIGVIENYNLHRFDR